MHCQLPGCGFHCALDINRQSNSKGLSKNFKEFPVVQEWFKRIRALMFVPASLYKTSGLLQSPVPPDHPAYEVRMFKSLIFFKFISRTVSHSYRTCSDSGSLSQRTSMSNST